MPRDEAYAAFVAARYRALVRTAFLLVGDRGHAEDLVQDALVKTYTHWARLDVPENAEAWTRRVLVRSVVRWRARRWRGEVPTLVLPDNGTEADHGVDLQRALASLPVGQRAVVVLRYLDDLSEAQTAELLGISPGTVKSRASRALASLRASGLLVVEEGPHD